MATEKLAFVCDDSITISAHFGRAPLVVVVTLEDGREVAREERIKERPGAIHLHEHGDDHDHGHERDHGHGHTHEHDHAHHHAHDHTGKFQTMTDCDAMIVRGGGSPAIAHAEGMGLRVYLVAERTVDEALAAYQNGALKSDERRIHRH